MNNLQLFQITVVWAFLSTALLLLIIYWNPYAIRLAFGKRFVWTCYADGSMEPVKATLDGVAYKTKDKGMYEFERGDVVLYGKKPGILVYAPYSKAMRPNVVPTLTKLKQLGIDRYDMLMAVLGSKVMSEKEFEDHMKKGAKNASSSE